MIRELVKKTLSTVGLPWLTGLTWYRRVLDACGWPEKSTAEIDRKVERFHDLANRNSYGRAYIWQELARLERLRGNHLVAAIYALRTMRLTGKDQAEQLPWVVDSLRELGCDPDANVAQAMFGSPDPARRFQECRSVLDKAQQTFRTTPPPDYAVLDDRRNNKSFRVSIVISMYHAASKLKVFLDSLTRQSLVERGEVELIFVDSASPTNEYEIVREHPLSGRELFVYGRTNSRETIQLAWNRGLSLASAPYIMMLCVDEACVEPDCLEVLASELDSDKRTDWLQSNCRVIEVDDKCNFVRDQFEFDRTGYCHGCEYLETGYLSYVGAMIRKSVFERFGYYDPSFRCAGDTEFKNRVLPFIQTRMLPRNLGLFWNYPDPRNSNQPRSELEDLRAWHLYRTLAGIDYSWATRSENEALEIAWKALLFRKSYDRVIRTDFEFAAQIVEWMRSRSIEGDIPAHTVELLDAVRTLDAPPRTLAAAMKAVRAAHRTIERAQQLHRQAGRPVDYNYFIDDRFEHFKFLWSDSP